MQSHPWTSFNHARFKGTKKVTLVPPGNHCCKAGIRGTVEWKACLTMLYVTSSRNQRPFDHKSITLFSLPHALGMLVIRDLMSLFPFRKQWDITPLVILCNVLPSFLVLKCICFDDWRDIFMKQSINKCGWINFWNFCALYLMSEHNWITSI